MAVAESLPIITPARVSVWVPALIWASAVTVWNPPCELNALAAKLLLVTPSTRTLMPEAE